MIIFDLCLLYKLVFDLFCYRFANASDDEIVGVIVLCMSMYTVNDPMLLMLNYMLVFENSCFL
jgi:hypothetical protein